MDKPRIRIGTIDDLDDMVLLEQQCFLSPWSRESLSYDVAGNPLSTYLVAELNGQVIGYVGVWTIVDEGHINNVAVSPDYRRQHIGSLLIETMLASTENKGITSHTLEVRAGNQAAIKLYESFGFIVEGVRKGYYEDDGEDALIMWRRGNTNHQT